MLVLLREELKPLAPSKLSNLGQGHETLFRARQLAWQESEPSPCVSIRYGKAVRHISAAEASKLENDSPPSPKPRKEGKPSGNLLFPYSNFLEPTVIDRE